MSRSSGSAPVRAGEVASLSRRRPARWTAVRRWSTPAHGRGQGAACGTVALVVPQGYHVARIDASAYNLGDNIFALPVGAMSCNQPQEPYLKRQYPNGAWTLVQQGNVEVGTFINWSQQTRIAYLSVSFERN